MICAGAAVVGVEVPAKADGGLEDLADGGTDADVAGAYCKDFLGLAAAEGADAGVPVFNGLCELRLTGSRLRPVSVRSVRELISVRPLPTLAVSSTSWSPSSFTSSLLEFKFGVGMRSARFAAGLDDGSGIGWDLV